MSFLKRLLFVFFFVFFLNQTSLAAEQIDINTATLEDLIKIIHIGQARAVELISLRPFASLDDLDRIKGIGPARIQDIKNQGIAFVSSLKTEEKIESLTTEKIEVNIENLANTIEPELLIIDINSATPEELIKIIHIGQARAVELISLRPFYSFDDLARINGIGEKTVQDIKNQGLAWIDPKLNPPQKIDLIENNMTAAAISALPRKSFNAPPWLISLAISILGGFTIWTLKKNLI